MTTVTHSIYGSSPQVVQSLLNDLIKAFCELVIRILRSQKPLVRYSKTVCV